MRVSALTVIAATLAIVSIMGLPVDARHLRHGGRESSDVTLTIKHHLEPVDTISTTDQPHVSMFREDAQAVQQDVKTEPIPAAVSALETPAPPTKAVKRSTGTCIGPLCGMSLFFTLLWVTFAVCVVVVYFVDRRFNPWNEVHVSKDSKQQQSKRRASGGVDVVRQATAYYQNVAASMNATLLRRRPLS